MRLVLLLVSITLASLVAPAQVAQPAETCRPQPTGATPIAPTPTADDDLYCIELLPAADIERASGTARLVPPSTPFGIAVTRAGETQHDVLFTLRDLPQPSALGKFSTFIAWALTPQLRPLVKLGEVREGTTRLGRVGFDRIHRADHGGTLNTGQRTWPAGGPAWHVCERSHAAARSRVSPGRSDRYKRRGGSRRARGSRGSRWQHITSQARRRLDAATDAPAGVDAAGFHVSEARCVVVPAGCRPDRAAGAAA